MTRFEDVNYRNVPGRGDMPGRVPGDPQYAEDGPEVSTWSTEVWKFALTTDGWVEMPKDAVLLHVAVQEGVPYVWAQVRPANRTVRRHVPVYGTGHVIDGSPTYVGTFHLDWLVFHVFSGGEVDL